MISILFQDKLILPFELPNILEPNIRERMECTAFGSAMAMAMALALGSGSASIPAYI